MQRSGTWFLFVMSAAEAHAVSDILALRRCANHVSICLREAHLYSQQIRCPFGPSSALPMSSFGTLGPRPLFLLLPFPFPFPFRGEGFGASCPGPSGECFRFVGAAFGDGDGLLALDDEPEAKGSRWKVTVGLESTIGRCFSRGSSPAGSLFMVVICSAMCKNAARSARNICTKEVLLYPGGGSSCRC